MYRFNGYDGRLDRTVEAALMVMEACQKLDNYKVVTNTIPEVSGNMYNKLCPVNVRAYLSVFLGVKYIGPLAVYQVHL